MFRKSATCEPLFSDILRRSSDIIREWASNASSEELGYMESTNDFHRIFPLVLSGESGPRYVLKSRMSTETRASKKIFYDASFANRLLSHTLLSRFSVRATCGILYMDFVAKKCSLTGIMPKRSCVANIIEYLVSRPEVTMLLQTLI